MDKRLADFEARCTSARQSPPDLSNVMARIYATLAMTPSAAFVATNERVIALMTIEAATTEPQYHNRYHVQDVVEAAALLLSTAADDMIPPHDRHALLTAALAHDLLHDGQAFLSEPELEWRSARNLVSIGRACGLPEGTLRLMETLIVSTFPPLQMSLRANMQATDVVEPASLLKLLLGEADVLASLTPRLGVRLSECLEEEWTAAGIHFSPSPSSLDGRRQFLSAYRQLSAAAIELGVGRMIAEQLGFHAGDRS